MKLALKCDSAEELGRLCRRYQRQGLATVHELAELDRLIGKA